MIAGCCLIRDTRPPGHRRATGYEARTAIRHRTARTRAQPSAAARGGGPSRAPLDGDPGADPGSGPGSGTRHHGSGGTIGRCQPALRRRASARFGPAGHVGVPVGADEHGQADPRICSQVGQSAAPSMLTSTSSPSNRYQVATLDGWPVGTHAGNDGWLRLGEERSDAVRQRSRRHALVIPPSTIGEPTSLRSGLRQRPPFLPGVRSLPEDASGVACSRCATKMHDTNRGAAHVPQVVPVLTHPAPAERVWLTD
jgi:hypothetical protein